MTGRIVKNHIERKKGKRNSKRNNIKKDNTIKIGTKRDSGRKRK